MKASSAPGMCSAVQHELGQSWPTEYGVVGGVEVDDVEVDVFNAVVACRAELYW